MTPLTPQAFDALVATLANPTIEADDVFGIQYLMVDGRTVACAALETADAK